MDPYRTLPQKDARKRLFDLTEKIGAQRLRGKIESTFYDHLTLLLIECNFEKTREFNEERHHQEFPPTFLRETYQTFQKSDTQLWLRWARWIRNSHPDPTYAYVSARFAKNIQGGNVDWNTMYSLSENEFDLKGRIRDAIWE